MMGRIELASYWTMLDHRATSCRKRHIAGACEWLSKRWLALAVLALLFMIRGSVLSAVLFFRLLSQ